MEENVAAASVELTTGEVDELETTFTPDAAAGESLQRGDGQTCGSMIKGPPEGGPHHQPPTTNLREPIERPTWHCSESAAASRR